MPRHRTRHALVAAACGSLLLAGCGGEPDAVEPLPPLAPPDLCALLPESATDGLLASASSDEDGDPTAACALRSESGQDVEVLVTWLLLQDDQRAQVVWESQCAGIDRNRLTETDTVVEGADETCAARGDDGGSDIASVAVRRVREVVTVRVTTRAEQDLTSLERARTLATGVLPELPDAR